jgi:excisionase family DNA binding protein
MKPATVKAKQAAEYLNISYWKILDMVKKGEIPHIKAGKLVLFRKETLDRWIEEQEAASVSG